MAKVTAKRSKKMAIRCWQVPFNRIEWVIVRNLFKSNDPAHLDVVLNLLSMWKTRMGRETPVAVDISDILIRSRKLEANAGEWNWETENGLVLSYSTAVIRFVNFVNEIGQKARHQHTITSIANALKPLGIPDWIIDVRHASTHKMMPSVNTLRRAVDFCRAWLWQCYWNKPIEESVQWRQVTLSNAEAPSVEEQYPSDVEILDEVGDVEASLDPGTAAASSPSEIPPPEQPESSEMSKDREDQVVAESPEVEEVAGDDDDVVYTLDDLKQNESAEIESEDTDGESSAKKLRKEEEDAEVIVVDDEEDDDGWRIAKGWTDVCQLGLTQHQTAESLCLGFGIHKDWSKEDPVPLSLDMYPEVVDDCSSQFPPIIVDEKLNVS